MCQRVVLAQYTLLAILVGNGCPTLILTQEIITFASVWRRVLIFRSGSRLRSEAINSSQHASQSPSVRFGLHPTKPTKQKTNNHSKQLSNTHLPQPNPENNVRPILSSSRIEQREEGHASKEGATVHGPEPSHSRRWIAGSPWVVPHVRSADHQQYSGTSS